MGLLALIGSLNARADNMVAVVSHATADYLGQRASETGKEAQTYVVMEGRFHPGSVSDRTLERMTFPEIAKRLAGDLKARSFVPAGSLATADLLLVVHWGTTSRKQSDRELRGLTGDELRGLAEKYANAREFEQQMQDSGRGSELDGSYWAINGSQTMESQLVFEGITDAHAKTDATIGKVSNARVLGLTNVLAKEDARLWDSEEGRTLRAMLEEERYFIIVNAYDCRALLRQSQLKRLWSTRLNIRSHGVNFIMALERMGSLGRLYFGTDQVGMVIKPAPVREGQVEIGDLIVIESREK